MVMNYEKIEKAYGLLLENVQLIQNHLKTNFYDALIEQNVAYTSKKSDLEQVEKHNHTLESLHLTKEEWRKSFQFLLIKGGQTEPLQWNHQFTPDSIGQLLTLVIDQLFPGPGLTVLELGSGTGNLALTLMNHSRFQIDYFGIEVDDLLIDLSASIADVIGAPLGLAQGDAVRPAILRESQCIVSDLPIGYYPDDQIASRYEVYSEQGHTFAHHLLMEQALKYLSKDGYALFLAPTNLLISDQSHLLKSWIEEQAHLVALINLPTNLFSSEELAKSLFVFQKREAKAVKPFVYPLTDLQDREQIEDLMQKFKNWQEANAM